MDLKELYTFTIYEDKETVVQESTVDEISKEETIVKKKVIVKSPTEILIKKPTRRQSEEADLEFSVEMSKCIKKGILTKAMLAKKYSDTGGLMSESESQELVDLYKQVFDLQSEHTKLDASTNKSDEIKAKQEEVLQQLDACRKKIIDIESSYRALFDHTADSKAQNKVLMWYILNLSFIKTELDTEFKPLYKGKEFEDKIADFYKKEESESGQYKSIANKLSTLIAFWFFNQASTKEDFVELDRKIEAGEL